MDYDNLLYLDVDFLADQYEQETGIAQGTVISRNEGMNAEAAIPFLKSGIQSHVTKQYSASSYAMLKAVNGRLEKQGIFSPVPEKGLTPRTAWIEGHLTIGQWGSDPNSQKALNVFFELKSGDYRYSLLPRKEYFFANLETLEIISPALQRFIWIPVRTLCRILYYLPDIKTFVIAPYVIEAGHK